MTTIGAVPDPPDTDPVQAALTRLKTEHNSLITALADVTIHAYTAALTNDPIPGGHMGEATAAWDRFRTAYLDFQQEVTPKGAEVELVAAGKVAVGDRVRWPHVWPDFHEVLEVRTSGSHVFLEFGDRPLICLHPLGRMERLVPESRTVALMRQADEAFGDDAA